MRYERPPQGEQGQRGGSGQPDKRVRAARQATTRAAAMRMSRDPSQTDQRLERAEYPTQYGIRAELAASA